MNRAAQLSLLILLMNNEAETRDVSLSPCLTAGDQPPDSGGQAADRHDHVVDSMIGFTCDEFL